MMTQNCGNRFPNPFTYVEKTKENYLLAKNIRLSWVGVIPKNEAI